MMLSTPLPSRHLALALAAGAALATAPAVRAAPLITLTAQELLGSVAGTPIDVIGGHANGGELLRGDADAGGNNVVFHTYGYTGDTTYFGVRVSGAGSFFARSSATYTDSYTNTSQTAQLVRFAFNVDKSTVGLFSDGTGHADLSLALGFSLNGGPESVVASEQGHIESDGSSMSCNVSGGAGVLANYLDCLGSANMAWAEAASFSVQQLLAAGDTLSVRYTIASELAVSLASVANALGCSYGNQRPEDVAQDVGATIDGVVAGGGATPVATNCIEFNAISASGDPLGFAPFAPAGFVIGAVPEPGSLPLSALGLGGLVLARQRRRRSHH